MKEIKGAIHVHSRYSDGTGSVEEIVSAAQAAGIDYLVLSDHDTTEAADDGYAGRHGDVLLLVGVEISPPGRGHCLALGAGDVTGYRWMPEKHYLRKLRRAKADVYVAHPEGRVKPAFGIKLKEWSIWESEHFDGLEIWSYMHDWVENVNLFNLPRYYFSPHKAIDGPDRKILRLWDMLNRRRRVVGLGALDAHAVRMFFGLFTAFPYEFLFRTILTHAFVDKWGDSDEDDTAAVRSALSHGRAFISYNALSPADGFRFFGDDSCLMGDRTSVGSGRTLFARLPRTAEISVIRNGQAIAVETADRIEMPVDDPGVYRVEVRLESHPWIFSNPIYLGREKPLDR